MQTVYTNIVDILEQSGVLLGPNDVGYYKVLTKLTVTSRICQTSYCKKGFTHCKLTVLTQKVESLLRQNK